VHELPLLVNIAVALAMALVGGLLARKVGLPTIVGYLLAGVAIGPFTPGFVGDAAAIGQLAELGVVFLMFGVGLHFSLRDLWRVREVAIPGAIVQTAVATLAAYALARSWGWSTSASLVLGLSISVASTVVLLRGLMDTGLLHTRHGSVAVGWLVLEDIATVLLLLVLPALAPSGAGFEWRALGITLAKAAAFIALMLVFGARVVPWVLMRIAHTRSRELFLLVALTVALGTALGSAALFGVSLALGAFLAGVVVSESPFSHQVGADVLPFREAFAVLFFVSVGMLVDPAFLLANAGRVLALSLVIVLGKAAAALALCILLGQPLRTGVVVAAGLGQIGEFSFILGHAGEQLGMLRSDQYGLILAGALVSISLNPLMFRLAGPVERVLERFALIRRFTGRRQRATDEVVAPREGGHVVIVGCGRVGGHIVAVLGQVGVPRLVVESDAARADELRALGVPVLFGDAANSEILSHATLPKARALVVTLPDEAAAGLVVAGAREIAPDLPIVARATTRAGVKQLVSLGARDVIHPELEGGLEVVRHTLLRLGFPLRAVQKYADAVRHDSYDVSLSTSEEHRALSGLLHAARSLEMSWVQLRSEGGFGDASLASLELRARAGASVVAVQRDGALIANPAPDFQLRAGDYLGLIGEADQLDAAEKLLGARNP
jgi:CPA2 family monovalent cation:H+ antiporter-2